MTMCRHDDQIGAEALRRVDDDLCRRPGLEDRADAMPLLLEVSRDALELLRRDTLLLADDRGEVGTGHVHVGRRGVVDRLDDVDEHHLRFEGFHESARIGERVERVA